MADQRGGGISWSDETWNPVRGCSRVSEGCRNCYAERVAGRFSGPGQPYHGLAVLDERGSRWTGKMLVVEKHLLDPIRWNRNRRIFVNSMSDLFHEGLSAERDIARVFAVMALAPRHTFQVLTKRATRMQEIVSDVAFKNEVERICRELDDSDAIPKSARSHTGFLRDTSDPDNSSPPIRWPLPNVWLGVSVEHQDAADERIPELLDTPAAVRFLSCEPLLGPLNLIDNGWISCVHNSDEQQDDHSACSPRLDWVIVGGESGPGARSMNAEWARSILDQCASAGVPPWFKQTGSVLARELGLKDRAGSDPLEFPDWARDQQRFPEVAR